jgi:biopolymer transport protein ExbD
MRFSRPKSSEPEINLIPFIDVLLVVLIFLMMTTTYGRLTQLDLRLPQADTAAQQEKPREIRVTITADGQYVVQKNQLSGNGIAAIGQALAAAAKEVNNPLVIISADARATHQSVMLVLEAAQNAGLQQITFSAQARSNTTAAQP